MVPREDVAAFITKTFGYRLDEPIDEIRKYYGFDITCPGSVPQAIRAFLESGGYEGAVRKAISIGGDRGQRGRRGRGAEGTSFNISIQMNYAGSLSKHRQNSLSIVICYKNV